MWQGALWDQAIDQTKFVDLVIEPGELAAESGRLKVAKGLREAEVLQLELQAFQRRITLTGHSAFEGVGQHDDLVIAVALVCWWAENSRSARAAPPPDRGR